MNLTKALRYTAVLAVVGVIITTVTVYIQLKVNSTYQQSIPAQILGRHVKAQAAEANAAFEKLVAGDQSVNFEQHVLAPLKSAGQLLQNIYDGKSSGLGHFPKPANEDTKALIKESVIGLESMVTAATARWDQKKNDTARAINEADKAYFQISDETGKKTEEMSAHLQRQSRDEVQGLSVITWVPAVLSFGAFAVLSLVYFRLQRKTDSIIAQNSEKLSEESRRVGTLTTFIESVSSGNYEIQLQKESEEDNLTDTLIKMRDKLKLDTDNDRKRNWATTGQAQIGEILRSTTSDSSELYDNILKFLVKYTKSNQGGLFIVDDEEGNQHLDLVACYAFERKKFLNKRLAAGDGLVGQCFLEGDTINLIEVPQEYVSITSGLGGSNPNALLIVPMKVNDRIYGVIELASFKKYEAHEIDLVEKLAESIASTISNVRVNETTKSLLAKTQQQAEEMKSQEEEIRQNMEELEATQEEMRRKQTILERELDQAQKQADGLRIQEKALTESQQTLQAIVDNIPRAIFWKDKDLRFMGCNRIFAQVAGASSTRELIGKTDFDMAWSAQAEAYRNDDLEVMRSRKPKLDIEEVNINSAGEESWVKTSKVPIITDRGDVVAILGMFEDITAQKRNDASVAGMLREREEVISELNALKDLLATKKV